MNGPERFKAKLKTVAMPAKEFEEEHAELPRILREGSQEERQEEAKRQESEARRERVKRKLKGVKE